MSLDCVHCKAPNFAQDDIGWWEGVRAGNSKANAGVLRYAQNDKR
jgi:hypothetical protein